MTTLLGLGMVLAAVYALLTCLLSTVVAVAWHLGFDRWRVSSNALLALRLLPSGIATVVSLTVALPAFVRYEPPHELEEGGPLIAVLALAATLAVGLGVARAWRASKRARGLWRTCDPDVPARTVAGTDVHVIDVPGAIAAVIGVLRPRVVTSACVHQICSDREFHQIVAHEAAHIASRDNLKLWFLLISPDLLSWLPAGAGLAARWRAAAEREADERASGQDPQDRLALASALIKVARQSARSPQPDRALCMQIAAHDVEDRVRCLLAPPQPARFHLLPWGLAATGLVMPLVGTLFQHRVYQMIEALVSYGR